jgi:hypothetical protein
MTSHILAQQAVLMCRLCAETLTDIGVFPMARHCFKTESVDQDRK